MQGSIASIVHVGLKRMMGWRLMAGKKSLTNEERERWLEGLRLVDDSFMRFCLGKPDSADNPASDLARACLQIITRAALDDDELEIVTRESQAELKSLTGRSVILDFRVRDGKGRLLDIEVESGSSDFSARRARLYAAMLDATALGEGEAADKLPDSYVIVISGRDFIGAGRLRSTFRRTCEEDGRRLGDGSTILYVNCQAADSTPLGRVAHDFLCADPGDMYVPELAELTGEAKGLKEGAMPRMQSDNVWEQKLIDMNYESGLEDGIEQGIEQGIERARFATSAMAESLRDLGVSQSDIDIALAAGHAVLAK